MKRKIAVEIDAGAKTCGKCEHCSRWADWVKHCYLFGGIVIGKENAHRCPACLEAEVSR